MEKKENVHVIDLVVDRMRKAAVDLEEFQLKVSLGKMEALDKYEEIKKSYKHLIQESKIKIAHSKERLEALHGKLDDLQVQFALGKAVTVEVFKAQKKRILNAIHEIEVSIKTNPTFVKSYAVLLETLETLKLKLEILSDKLEPAKKRVGKVIQDGKAEVERILSSFQKKFKKRINYERRMDVFQDELAIAYKHFRKAFARA